MKRQPPIPEALWVVGRGPWETQAWCPPGLTVMRWSTEWAARAAQRRLDLVGCGHRCTKLHLVTEAAREKVA